MNRILFITLSNIGDAVMTTPVLERLHQLYPEARIDIVADPRSSELFTHCPYRGEIFLKDKKTGWPGLLALIRTLRRQRYDLIVDLRTDGLAYLLRAVRRLTKMRARPLGPHAVEEHMGVIRPIAGKQIPPLRLWLNDDLRARAARWLEQLPGDRILGIGPGANWPGKIWPERHLSELVRLLARRFDGVVLLGGPSDASRAAAIAADIPLPAINSCGRTSLLEAGALLESVTVFVGNDSGLGHMAAAVGTRTVVVFGSSPAERYHPRGQRARWVASPERNLQALAPGAVASKVVELLEADANDLRTRSPRH